MATVSGKTAQIDTNEDINKVEFCIRPPPESKFNKDIIKETIHSFLNDELAGKVYSNNNEENEKLCHYLSKKLKQILREKINSDYKLVVRVILGELRGAGIRAAARCLWDSANDCMSNVSFENESLFCVATMFAVYPY